MANELATVTQELYLAPAAALATVLEAYQAKKEFINRVLQQDTDYGVIPGATKPALLKPGAEKMASYFGLTPVFEDVATEEDWTGAAHNGEPFFYYRQKCKLFRGERLVGSADGSCNSWEKKYRYRQQERVCPNCGKATIVKGKAEYGGGWICFAKKGGCGAKFKPGDATIEGQQLGQVSNPDIAEQVNTILKMAQKRALIAAVLISTNASDYFTQDVEDFVAHDVIEAQFTAIAPEPRPEPGMAETGAALGAKVTPQPAANGNGKKPPTRAGLLARLAELEEQAEKAGLVLDAFDIQNATDAEITERGKAIAALVNH